MNLVARVVTAAALALCGLPASAETLFVTLSAPFEMPPLTSGPTLATLSFAVDTPVSAIQQTQGVAVLENVPIHLSVANAAGTGVADRNTTTVGWFGYSDQNYFGIDVRLRNLLVPGDVMQFIWALPAPPYSGPDTAPVLVQQDLTGLPGAVCYYATGSGVCTYSHNFSDGAYQLSAVPEPGSALLLLAGLALVARRRTRR